MTMREIQGFLLELWPPARSCSKLAGLKLLMDWRRRAGFKQVPGACSERAVRPRLGPLSGSSCKADRSCLAYAPSWPLSRHLGCGRPFREHPDIAGCSPRSSNKRAQPRVHLLRLAMYGPTVAGQYPLESIIGELCKRRAECAPGLPARIAKCMFGSRTKSASECLISAYACAETARRSSGYASSRPITARA